MFLDSKQYKFLKSLSSVDRIPCNPLSDSDMKIARFLKDEGLINVHQNAIPRPIPGTRKIEYSYGEWISISISESGKAYLAE